MDGVAPVTARIEIESRLGELVADNAVLELQPFERVLVVLRQIEVGLSSDGGLLDESVRHRVTEAITVDDVLKVLRRGRQLKSKDRLQRVDGSHASRGAVAVGLIHEQHEIG